MEKHDYALYPTALSPGATFKIEENCPTYPLVCQQAKKKQMKGIPNHKVLVEGLGYVPGVCWKILRKTQKKCEVHAWGGKTGGM